MRPPRSEDEYWAQRDLRIERLRDPIQNSHQSNTPTLYSRMSMLERYLENIIHSCSEERFGQEAVEHAILSGRVVLTYHREADLRAIMGQPNQPNTGLYETLIEEYQAVVRQNEAVLVDSYAPLLQQIDRLAA